MEKDTEQRDDRQLLAAMGACLDALTDDRLRLPTAAEQLELLQEGIRLSARLQAWTHQLAARIDATDAAWQERKTSTRTWLAESMRLTGREAARLIRAGQGLHRFPVIGEAALAGSVLPAQAEAITGVLADLPREFDGPPMAEAEQLMAGFAETHNSAELRRLTDHLVEVLSPDTADELEAKRLERQERRARARRFLDFTDDGEGSLLIRGSLPIESAEPLIRIVDAYAAAAKRGIDRLDPAAEYVTAAMRRADGLVAMVEQHTRRALAPAHGGDRPRIVVTLSYDKLAQRCADAGLGTEPGQGVASAGGVPVSSGARLVRDGRPIAAATMRRLLCDADLLPVVLGGAGEPLDVGRSRRLVTPPIRAALELRDRGCVFPGCEKPPEQCEAHHVLPWWAGGVTALHNLVLVCPHHHGIVEPGRDPDADRWRVELRDGSDATVIPPRRVDPRQRPRVHARFVTRAQEPA